MLAFGTSVLASVVGGFLLLLFAAALSSKARWVLTATLGRLLDVDVEFVFSNKEGAAADIREEINRAAYVYLLTGRGMELQRATFAPILAGAHPKDVRILLPDLSPVGAMPDWTSRRESELAEVDAAFGDGILRKQIQTTADFLSPYVRRGAVQLRGFNYPHIGRVLLTNRAAYFTPYQSNAHGRDCRVMKHRAGGDMYDCWHRLFLQLWETSPDLLDTGPEQPAPEDALSRNHPEG